MTRYSFLIYDNGREVELDDVGAYATEAEAERAALAALDDCVPPLSPLRKHYRYDIVSSSDPTFRTYPLTRDAADAIAKWQLSGGVLAVDDSGHEPLWFAGEPEDVAQYFPQREQSWREMTIDALVAAGWGEDDINAAMRDFVEPTQESAR